MKYWYKKPKGMKWTDLCIYFDAHIYDENKSEEEDNKLFQYMFCIYHMLASKKHYFDEEEDYNKFAMYAAGETWRRIATNTIGTKHGGKPGRLVSILNYAKASLSLFRIRYLSEEFNYTTDPKKVDIEKMELDYRDSIRANNRSKLVVEEVMSEIYNIDSIIWEEINDTPFKSNKLMCKRLYTSCLLTLLSGLILNKDAVKKLYKCKKRTYNYKYDLVNTLLTEERVNSVVCWNLPDSMKDYIYILTTKVWNSLVKRIGRIKQNYELTEDVISSIITSITTEAYGGNDEALNNNISFDEVRDIW